ncbi:MAG TPA: alpha/beta fold hydrolase [Tepidisphaeraceae bacterium]|nr:alpha/beta fold hydrolase [Tepidisphaeraceae bacterium]
MNYLDRGRGLPIILVHCFPLDSRMWQAQIDALSDHYRIIAPDLRGFGQSISSESFTINSLADDLHALLSNIGALPCLLAGLSMGGYVALAYAKKFPADLRGLALIDTRADADTPEARENRNKMIELAKSAGSKAIADAMFPKLLCASTIQNHPPIAQNARLIMQSQSPLTLQHALAAMRDREDQTGNLPSIVVPTLILVGEQDAITPPPMAQAMQKLLPDSKLVPIPDAGHLSPMEQPDAVNRALQQFAEEIRITKPE